VHITYFLSLTSECLKAMHEDIKIEMKFFYSLLFQECVCGMYGGSVTGSRLFIL
jgi:hypothetical protein